MTDETAQVTSNDQLPGEPLVSVTLTGEEFKKLTDEMAETDRINGESVKRIMDLEHANVVLERRVERLCTAMWKYGKHLSSCAIQTRLTASCTCKWVDVRETLAGNAERPTDETKPVLRACTEGHHEFDENTWFCKYCGERQAPL